MNQLKPESLSWRDWMLVIRVVLSLPLIEFMLSRRGVKRSYATLARWTREPDSEAAHSNARAAEAQHIASVFILANRRFSFREARCLPASLLLWRLLRRRRIPADLCLGVRTLTGEFEAHAWVELEGLVLNDDQEVQVVYAPFDLQPLSASVTEA